MFNSIASLLIGFFFLCSCNNAAKTEPATKDNLHTKSDDTVPVNKPTAQTDENGCKTANGETWSIVRKSCIHLSEIGIKLEPQEGAMDKTNPAWLVFTEDKVRVEIILPTQKKPVIIRKSSAEGEPPKWANGPLTLAESNGTYTLDDEGKILYKGPSMK